MEKFDYIIIGAGSAGCVLANRLTANPKISVLLLEAGGKDINPWIHIPGGYFKTMHNPSTDWCFKIEKDPGLNNRKMNFPDDGKFVKGYIYDRDKVEKSLYSYFNGDVIIAHILLYIAGIIQLSNVIFLIN